MLPTKKVIKDLKIDHIKLVTNPVKVKGGARPLTGFYAGA